MTVPNFQRLTVKGIVERGAGDGRKIGFPTANISLSHPLSLEYGVYASIARVDGQSYKSITHYGPRLVFGETHPLFEVHIFDFNTSIYGKELVVEVRDFIRKTQPFPSLEAMKRQILEDCEKAKRLL